MIALLSRPFTDALVALFAPWFLLALGGVAFVATLPVFAAVAVFHLVRGAWR